MRPRIVFAGAGHAALIALDRLAKRRLAADLVLVSSAPHAHYSGMLAGWVEGLYGVEEFAIDLPAFCRSRGITFCQGTLDAVDGEHLTVEGQSVPFDLCVLNTGAATARPGALADPSVLCAKPIGPLLERLGDTPIRGNHRAIAIVGAGAAGVECAMALAVGAPDARVHLIDRSETLLPSFPQGASAVIAQRLAALGVDVHLETSVSAVCPQGLRLGSGAEIAADLTIAFTGPAPPPFLAASSLTLAPDGFVEVDAALRTSLPNVLAVGDVATRTADPRPKAGVFAVRSGGPLARQVERWVAREPLRAVRLQRRALAIIALGERRAVAVRGRLWREGRGMWRLKDRFDRAFVARFRP